MPQVAGPETTGILWGVSDDVTPAETAAARGAAPEGASSTDDAVTPDPSAKKRLVKHLVLYTLARLALFAALTAVIMLIGSLAVDEFPLLLAMVLALLVSLPLSMVLFKSLRLSVNQDIAVVDATRRAHRADLEAKLRGEAE